jgi:hypothetical protein
MHFNLEIAIRKYLSSAAPEASEGPSGLLPIGSVASLRERS